MNKKEFLESLQNALSGLPQEEIRKTLDYYSEIIDDALEEGEDEIIVTVRLGRIEDIAEKIINETPLTVLVKDNIKKRRMSAFMIVLIILSSPVWVPLLTAVLTVIFTLYLSLWSIAAAIFAIFASLALSGAVLLIASVFMIFTESLKAVLSFGTALMCLGAAVFLFYIAMICVKLLIKLTVFTGRKIKNAFIRKGGNNNESK